MFLNNNGEIVTISLFADMETREVIVCHSLCEKGIKMLERLSKSQQAYWRKLTLCPLFLFMFRKTLLKAIFKVKLWERFIPGFT